MNKYSAKRRPVIMCAVGARPNFVKIAPILSALAADDRLDTVLVHTGQHYDLSMSDSFFRDLSIREPDINLAVGSATHSVQTAEILKSFDGLLVENRPDAVLVVGDVNSTLAAALAAAKRVIPVVHVEAGLRSFDRAMPEEINRVLTDQISDLLFTTEQSAVDNLLREGVARNRIHFVGNVMIDALRRCLPRAVPAATTFSSAGIGKMPARYAVATLHRPANVDDPAVLGPLLDMFLEIGRDLPIIFPIHPRTHQRIEASGFAGRMTGSALYPIAPVGYLEMLGLLSKATLVLTDSGGLQEESTVLGVPCFTLREATERPITVEQGTSTIVGSDPSRIRTAYRDLMDTGGKKGRVPDLWDGKASERIATVLAEWFGVLN